MDGSPVPEHHRQRLEVLIRATALMQGSKRNLDEAELARLEEQLVDAMFPIGIRVRARRSPAPSDVAAAPAAQAPQPPPASERGFTTCLGCTDRLDCTLSHACRLDELDTPPRVA